MIKRLLNLHIFIFIMISQMVFAQKDLVIEQKDGTKICKLVNSIEKITFEDTPTTMTDIEGNVYNTVVIGNQVWMAKNLKTTKYNDGTSIPNVTDAATWSGLSTGAYCAYNNDESNESDTLGYLYNWYAVDTGKLAPEGWHVPTDAEWQKLADYLGGGSVAGGKLKSTSDYGTDDYGFTGLLAGNRAIDGDYYSVDDLAYFWSATGDNSIAWYRYLRYSNTEFYLMTNGNKGNGFSVRCVRD